MRNLSCGHGRVATVAAGGVIALTIVLFGVGSAAAATVWVNVRHGQTLVERGFAPQGVRVCLQTPTRSGHRWRNLVCARSRAKRGFVLRWRAPASFRSSAARIAYGSGRVHVIRHLELNVVVVRHLPTPKPKPTPAPPSTLTPSPPLPTNPAVTPPAVLQDYALHVVFWTPPGSTLDSSVQPAVSQLETDIAAALGSGHTDNIFAVPGLYPGGDPRIASIDTTVTSDPIPTDSGESWCQVASQPCTTAAQIGDEVTRLSAENGWQGGAHDLTLVVLGQQVLACDDAGTCSQSGEACGFHSYAVANNQAYPYALIIMSGDYAACGGNGASPPDKYYAIALIGHEQNEAVADPNTMGTEIADPCQGHFGDNSINGHEYSLPSLMLPSGQCSIVHQFVATLDTTFAVSPGSPSAGQTVTFTPAAHEDPGGEVTYEAWCFGDSNACTQAQGTVTHAYASAGTYTVVHYVYDLDGQNQSSQQTVTVN